jgi:hypothetical protein
MRMLERYAHPSGAEMSRAVRVLTAYSDRHKNWHSDEKRSECSEQARSREYCEIGRYDLASPTGPDPQWTREIPGEVKAA